ncbi:MAG: alpha/beta hydrolase [Anaerolineae bacterium]
MPFAELSTGAALHYSDTGGAGETVIIIHGLMGIPHKDFAQLIAWLQSDYRVIAPSLRGYGESTPKPRIFPYDFYQRDAKDVLAFMDALSIAKAHILGYSDGAEVALLAAGTAPERFHSVAVWGGVGYFGPAMRPVVQRYYPGAWITDEERAAHGIDNPAAFILGWVQAVKRIIDSGGDLSLSMAGSITAPLLLMLGTRDTLNPVEYGQTFVDRTPNGQLVTFDCGHPVHDQAWPQFQQAVGDFLKKSAP